MKIDLGCGASKKEGFIGIDRNPGVNPDILMDVDTHSLAYKLGENSVDYIYSCHFLEHTKDLLRLLEQMWLVSKHGARWEILVPPASTEHFHNPFHHYRFTEWTFRFFEVDSKFSMPLWGTIGYGTGDPLFPVKLKEVLQQISERSHLFLLDVVK